MLNFLKTEHYAALSAVYIFLLLGYIFSLGFYSFAGIWIVTATFLLFVSINFFKLPKFFQLNLFGLEKFLIVILILSIALALYSPKGPYENVTFLKSIQFYIFLTAFIGSFSFLKDFKNNLIKNIRLLTLAALPIISKVIIVINSPSPKIDVWDILQKASLGIIHGQNPYTMFFTKIYPDRIPDYFTYMPLSFLLTIPTRIILTDIRFTFIIAEIIVAGVIYIIGRKNPKYTKITNLLMLIFLFHPLGTYIIEESWLDPLILAAFALFGAFYIRIKNKFWSLFLLSLAFGVKQNMIFTVPFLLRLKGLNFKKIAISFLPIFALTAFFLLLSPKDFIADTFLEPYRRNPRLNALTISAFFKSVNFPSSIYFVNIIILIASYLLLLKNPLKNITNFFQIFTLWFFTWSIFFRESFLNQYYFISALIILTIFFSLLENSIGERK